MHTAGWSYTALYEVWGQESVQWMAGCKVSAWHGRICLDMALQDADMLLQNSQHVCRNTPSCMRATQKRHCTSSFVALHHALVSLPCTRRSARKARVNRAESQFI